MNICSNIEEDIQYFIYFPDFFSWFVVIHFIETTCVISKHVQPMIHRGYTNDIRAPAIAVPIFAIIPSFDR